MLYVVGTGRCGTATIAAQMSGLHEPRPWIVEEAYDFYMGEQRLVSALLEKLEARAAFETPVISDNRQSYVIPAIRDVDPDARFIVLIREPSECIASMLHRGAYQRPKWFWDVYRPRPCTGFPIHWSPVMKIGWLWSETYRTIFSTLGNSPYTIRFTHDLGDQVRNASNARPAMKLREKEQSFLERRVYPKWDQICTLAQDREDVSTLF